MVLKLLMVTGIILFSIGVMAQSTTTSKQLDSVVVSHSRFQKTDDAFGANKIPMPVTIVTRATIQQMGSRRLDEVLREQTGLVLVSDLGAGNRAIGLQMQGFSAAYITILLNGQPMGGRTNGNFDLSRISVSDIERIEIVKGASSSLYGSEALGGVINIITKQEIARTQGFAELSTGTYRTTDVTLDGETVLFQQKGSAQLSANYFHTNGFNVNPYLEKGSKTAPPYTSTSLNGKMGFRWNAKNSLQLTVRFAARNSEMTRNYGASPYTDFLRENDGNAMLVWNSQWNARNRLITKYYFSGYGSTQEIVLHQNMQTLSFNRFKEYRNRVETQLVRNAVPGKPGTVAGAGVEVLSASGNTNGSVQRMFNYFGYTQLNWKPLPVISMLAGLRYDGNSLFGGKATPSVAVCYAPASWISLNPSVGWGFKAPAYQQMFQVFTNITSGYTVVGANVFEEGIQALKNGGEVQQVWPLAQKVSSLEPETSLSLNMGITLNPLSQLEIKMNGFYNNIQNLISEQQVGTKTNGAPIYSYLNIARSFTGGMENSAQWKPVTGLLISAGYQLLYAKDKTILQDSIDNGKATVRDTPPRKATRKDYFGLPNRSRHAANAQLFYTYKPWGISFSFRTQYRSKSGFLDRDVNGFIDPYDVFIESYFLFNTAVQKKLWKEKITLQLSLENLGNYTNYLLPAQPGRMLTTGAVFHFSKKEP